MDTVDFVPKDLDTGKEEGGRKEGGRREEEGVRGRSETDGGRRKEEVGSTIRSNVSVISSELLLPSFACVTTHNPHTTVHSV